MSILAPFRHFRQPKWCTRLVITPGHSGAGGAHVGSTVPLTGSWTHASVLGFSVTDLFGAYFMDAWPRLEVASSTTGLHDAALHRLNLMHIDEAGEMQ